METIQKSKILNWKIGGDFETFLQDKQTKKIYTAEGIIKGTKNDPYHFDPENNYYATSLDCVLSEFNVEPCTSPGQYYLAIQKALKYIDSILPQNMEIATIPCSRMDYDQLVSETANLFGCSVSYNAWNLEPIHPIPTGDSLRSAGAHIHIGYDNHNSETSIELIKAMDLFLGIPSILIEPENERKQVGYGCAGNFRLQDYGGVEYRTLSSHFISTQELIEWMFRNTERAIQFINEERINEIINFGNEIQDIINNSNKELAKEFVERFNLEII